MVAEKYETFTDSSSVKGTQPTTCSPLLPGDVIGKTYQGRYSVYPPPLGEIMLVLIALQQNPWAKAK